MARQKMILVVEDDADIGRAVLSLLQEEGYEAILATDGVAALEYLGTRPRPDLILLDLMMPRMNGWEFRKHQLAVSSWAAVPTIVLSACGRDDLGLLRAAAVLRKPADIDELIGTIDSQLGER